MSTEHPDRVDVIFGAKIQDLITGMKEAHASVREGVEGMKGQLEKLNSAVGAIRGAFLAFTAVIAGGELFEKAIEHTAELGAELEVLSKKTGVTATELSRLRFAANISEVSAGSLTIALTRMAKGMQGAELDAGTAAKAYSALGISVKDAEGHLRPVQEVLLDVADKFHDMEDGAGKTAIAMNLFGRSGADMIPLLNQGRAEIAQLEQESDRLGNTMSSKTVAASIEYVEAMKRVKAEVHGFSQSVAGEVMPSLTTLANGFTDSGTAATGTSVTVQVLGGTVRFLSATVLGLKETFDVLFAEAKFVFGSIGDYIGRVATAFELLLQHNFRGALSAFTGITGDVAKRWDEMADSITLSQEKLSDDMSALFGFGPPDTKGEGPGEGGKTKAPSLPGTAKDDRLAAAREELATLKLESGKNADDLLRLEIDFWRQKLATVTGNTKEDVKVRRAMHAQLVAAELKLAADLRRAGAIHTQTMRDGMLEQLDVMKETIVEKRALGEVDARAAGAMLSAIAQEELAIKLDALNQERQLAEGDAVQQAKLDKQIADAKRASSKEVMAISKQTTQTIVAEYERAFSTITNTIRKSFDGVIMGTQTFRDAMRNLNRNLVLDFAASKLEELKHHLAIEKAKEGASWASAIGRVAADTWASIQSVAKTAWAALSNIAAYAAQAAAATWAAISAIPLVGPFLAPAAAGAAAIGVLGLIGTVRSAAGGFDVPAGINPMTQLHAQEMVLPADLANKVRGMADGGGGGETHIHIHAIDTRGVEGFVRTYHRELAQGVKTSIKNGTLTAKDLGRG